MFLYSNMSNMLNDTSSIFNAQIFALSVAYVVSSLSAKYDIENL